MNIQIMRRDLLDRKGQRNTVYIGDHHKATIPKSLVMKGKPRMAVEYYSLLKSFFI